MINIIKKSVKQVNQNPGITLFFVFFLILTCLFAPYVFMMAKTYSFIVLLCIFFLTVLFLGGWFQMFDEITKDSKKSMVGTFFEGAGKNIIPGTILLIVYIILFTLVNYIAFRISMKLFGNPLTILSGMENIVKDKATYMEYINNLSTDDTLLLLSWQFMFIVSYAFYHFLFLFLPVTFIKSDDKNLFLKPFKACFCNLAFIYKNFGFSVLTYIIICFGFILMGILKAVCSLHYILGIIFIIVNIYFISYVVMIIFNCYEQKNSCIDGSDSIGQDQSSDSDGKEE